MTVQEDPGLSLELLILRIVHFLARLGAGLKSTIALDNSTSAKHSTESVRFISQWFHYVHVIAQA